MRVQLFMLGVVLLIGCGPSGSQNLHVSPPPDRPVELIEVTYAGLDEAIAAQKGKVVVVDVWATFCVPCVKKFPSFVKLHEKYAAKGLVCISASTDKKDMHDDALNFLKEQNARFANYRFSESNAKISKELDEKYPTDRQPVMFVFNRKGEKVKQFEATTKFEEIEAYLAKFLEEK